MIMKNGILFLVMLASAAGGPATGVCAQQTLQSGTVVTDASVVRHRDSVTVNMVINLDGTEVKSGKSVILQPRYVADGGTESAYLPPVEVMGRTRSLYLQRNPEAAYTDDVYCRVVKKRKEVQQVAYRVTIPYEAWMDRSRLQVVEDRCGCGEVEKGNLTELAEADLAFHPQLAYVVPQAEPVKTRNLSGRSFLDFRVNRTDIDPAYRKNPVELRRILASIDTVRNDRDFTITSIELCGYASPEGSYEANRRLAEGRTEALKTYLLDKYDFAPSLIRSASEPENWQGLVEYIQASQLADKEEILAYIGNGPSDIDVKERQLRTKFPQSYAVLLADCYPGLRRTDYRIDYVIRKFNLEEARALVTRDPKRLSLEELFAVAQTYEPGSEEFNRVFDVAIRMYPDSEVANLNAACALLEQGQAEQALTYLQRVKTESPEAENARGVAYLLLKDYDRAGQHLNRAVKQGLQAAEHNWNFLN